MARPVGRPRKNPEDTEALDMADPVDRVVMGDQEQIADKFATILEGLEGIDEGAIKGMLYRVPPGHGKYEWIKQINPPFDFTTIMEELREDFGGGDFVLRLIVGNRIRKNVQFTIARDPKAKKNDPSQRGEDRSFEFMQLMMSQQNSARSDMQTMMTVMMQQQAQSSDRMMQMMTVLVPALMGGKEKTSELLTAFATLQNMGGNKDGMKELLENAVLLKGLIGPGENSASGIGEDVGGLIGEGLKLAGPLVGSLAKTLSERRSNPAPQTHMMPIPDQNGGIFIPAQPVMLPGPGMEAVAGAQEPEAASRFPILDLIREDVLFMFKRRRNPEIAAEVALEIIDKASIDEAALQELVGAFMSSPDWLADLAAEGIDFREDPIWANQFLTALIQLYTDNAGDGDDSGRGEGGAPNNGDNGASGLGGVAAASGEDPSSTAN